MVKVCLNPSKIKEDIHDHVFSERSYCLVKYMVLFPGILTPVFVNGLTWNISSTLYLQVFKVLLKKDLVLQ